MAAAYRASPEALSFLQALADEPHKFGFFECVRRLENLYRDKPRVGTSARAADDPIRLEQEPSLAFAPSTVASFKAGKGGEPDRLSSFFLGLFGPNAPLPLHLTEYARDRLRNAHDPTFASFANVFHHRMLSMFYRAWADAQPTVNFDRPESDRFQVYLGALFGIGTPSLRDRDALPDLAKLHRAGLFAGQTRNAEGLRSILEDYLKLPMRILEFVGEWMELPKNCRLRLGESLETGALGTTATIGAHVWGCQQKFRVVCGAISLRDLDGLLPGGESLAQLAAVVRNYVGDELNWDLQLILRKEEVPPIRLGESGQLGWTTWLMPRAKDEDADDIVLNPYRILFEESGNSIMAVGS